MNKSNNITAYSTHGNPVGTCTATTTTKPGQVYTVYTNYNTTTRKGK